MRKFSKVSAAFLTTLLLPSVAGAAETFSGEYTVSYLGLPIARSIFTSRIEGERIRISGTVSSAGIAKIFDSTTGSSSFSGNISQQGVVPASFTTSYKSGKKSQRTSITFVDGNVAKTVNVPPTKKRRRWVPLRSGDLRAVSDPISATLIRTKSQRHVCNRTIKIYDGEMRANIVLRHMSVGKVPGYNDEAVTCSAKFVPVSGYRPDSSSLAYLKNRSEITISFAPLGQTGIYAPVHATVGTKIGTVTVTARRSAE
ncbi:MAG: DUF3108 domain-containing protein [Rhizobiaceae bacterium]|nr:DUF3108 domain-containing protein [Rhizobiaceae bacterium]